MQSRITIEVDFENGNEPVIQIISRSTDDVRDKLIRFFFELLGGNSWCRITCVGATTHEEGFADKFQRWHISPIKPEELKEEGTSMIEQFRLQQSNK